MANKGRSNSVHAELPEIDGAVQGQFDDRVEPSPRMVSGFAPRGSADELERTFIGAAGTELVREPASVIQLPSLGLGEDGYAGPGLKESAKLASQGAPVGRRLAVLVVLFAVVLGSGLGYWFRVGRPTFQGSTKAPASVGASVHQTVPTPVLIPPKLEELAAVEKPQARLPFKGSPQQNVNVSARAKHPPETSTRTVKRAAKAAARLTVPAAPTPKAVLPDTLTRTQVRAGFEATRGKLRACGGGGGLLEVTATITSTGRVTHALVGGDYSGTPAGSCMAKAVRRASFPAFKDGPIRVQYPFSL